MRIGQCSPMVSKQKKISKQWSRDDERCREEGKKREKVVGARETHAGVIELYYRMCRSFYGYSVHCTQCVHTCTTGDMWKGIRQNPYIRTQASKSMVKSIFEVCD